jgi:hypothetical protein
VAWNNKIAGAMDNVQPEDLTRAGLVKALKVLDEKYSDLVAVCLKSKDSAVRKKAEAQGIPPSNQLTPMVITVVQQKDQQGGKK